jgi:hypothetical protein
MTTQNTVAKQAYGLISAFEKSFEAKHGRKPQVNRYRDKWGFQDMIADLGYNQAKDVVEYYLTTAKPGHPLAFLFQNYDRINQFMEEKREDEKKRAEIRKQTEQRVKGLEETSG